MVLFLNLMGQGTAPQRWKNKSTKFTFSYRSSCKTRPGLKIASRRLLRKWPSRRLRLRYWTDCWEPCGSRHFFGNERSSLDWAMLGTCLDRVTAPQPLDLSGPMAQGHLMTEIQDAGLIRSQALKMNKREVPYYFDSLASNTTKVRIHCEAGSVSASLVCETRAKCQDFVARYEDDGIPYATNCPFCCANTIITVRQSKSLVVQEAQSTKGSHDASVITCATWEKLCVRCSCLHPRRLQWIAIDCKRNQL